MLRLTTTVVIPCYNAALLLDEALASVARQRHQADQVVVVDDGSTDASARVAERHGVQCLRLERNAGPAAARNVGTRAATSDVVAFLDADDVWDPQHLETMLSLLERWPDAGVAFSRMRVIGESTIVNPVSMPPDVPFDALLPLLGLNFVAQSAAAVRRSILITSGGYDESARLAEDYRLWLKLASATPFVYSGDVTAGYRRHDAQTSVDDDAVHLETWRARAEVLAPGWLRPHDPPRELIVRYLHRIYNMELRDVWLERDRKRLHARLAAGSVVPGSAPVFRRWRRRERLLWHAWVYAAAPLTVLPARLRVVLRRLIATMFRKSMPEG